MAGGLLVFGYYSLQPDDIERCWTVYPLTNHDLACDEYAEARNRMHTLNADLAQMSERYKQEGKVENISIWVRDLSTRQWAAYNEHETYAPASLLKLPLLLAYYKIAELDPSILQDRLTYQPNDENDGYIKPSHTLTPGTEYSVEELLQQMIRSSDNNPIRSLAEHISPQIINNTLTDLGLQITNSSDTFQFVTAKTYANVFRILHNASYLDRDYSEKALDLLTTVEYRGMSKPLPPTVRVAHKFGERELINNEGVVSGVQLHDCGVVYKKSSPFSLCVMTQGKDFMTLSTVIEEVSKAVYDAF